MFPTLIRKQVDQLLEHMHHTEGYVTRRSFKQYLLSQRLYQPSDLNELLQNMEMIFELLPEQRIPDTM